MSKSPPKNTAEKAQSVALPLERQTYTIEEAAKILGICRAVAYRRGVLPTVQVGGRRLVPKQALERMLDNRSEVAAPVSRSHRVAGRQ
jgi:excisionase family DNA binding protein